MVLIAVTVGRVLGESAVFLGFGLFALSSIFLGAKVAWAKCPRCGDHFFSGALRSPNPVLGGAMLRQTSCVNCKLPLAGE